MKISHLQDAIFLFGFAAEMSIGGDLMLQSLSSNEYLIRLPNMSKKRSNLDREKL